MKIIVDSREQTPFNFKDYPVEVETGTLMSGDYSIPGFEDRVAVERKSLDDLLGCLTHDRDRFIREMQRLRGFESVAVVVEAPFDQLVDGRYRSKMPPASAVQSVISFMAVFRVPFFFAPRLRAERFTYDFLRHYSNHAEARYKAVCRWSS